MKKSTLIVASVILLGSMSAEADVRPGRFAVKNETQKKDKAELVRDAKANMNAAYVKSVQKTEESGEAIWRNTKETGYSYVDGVWEFEGSYERKYNTIGDAVYELYTDFEEDQYEYNYTYDANRQLATSDCVYLGEGGAEPYTKGEYKYDSRVTDFCTSKLNYNWDGEAWADDYGNYIRTVDRNADGNVTSVVVSILYMGAYTSTERTDITYDATTGKADTYVFSRLGGMDADGNPIWNKELDLFDIEWYCTDGQLVRDWQSFLLGNNRISKASVYYDGEFDGYQKVSYTEGKADFVSEETDIDGNVYVKTVYTTLDDNGSFKIDTYEYEREGAEILDEYITTDVAKYNEKGDLVSIENFETMEGETMQIGGELYTYTYDSATGVMQESLWSMYDMDAGTYTPALKIVYSDPIDVTQSGVGAVKVNENLPVEYYNLQGMKVNVDDLGNGIYIKKQGAEATKVMIRK